MSATNQKRELSAIHESCAAIDRYDATIEVDLDQLTDTKVAALTVLESMMELNDEVAKNIAASLRATLNVEELYLAMNRFYYIDFYLKNRPGFADDPEVHPQKHLKAGHQCFYILARLRDLTGEEYEWATAKSRRREKALAIAEERYTSRVDVLDGELLLRFDRWVEVKKAEVGSADKFERQLYLEYSKAFLLELDRHGGDVLGDEADRFAWYRERTRSIEFLRDDELQKVYFELPSVKLSETSRKALKMKMNFTSPQHKVRGRARIRWPASLATHRYPAGACWRAACRPGRGPPRAWRGSQQGSRSRC